MLPNLVDRADIRVIERRSRPRLPAKSLQRLRIASQLLGEELQGDMAT